jgi:hypothetical protein
MSASSRQKNREMAAIASDYIVRMAPSNRSSTAGNSVGQPKDNKQASMAGSSSTGAKKKKSSIDKAYIQAYEWSEAEFHEPTPQSKTKKPAPPVYRTVFMSRLSAVTEPTIPSIFDETLSRSESSPVTPTRRYNNAHGVPREPMSAPLPGGISSPPSTRDFRAERDSFNAPSVLRYEKISRSDNRLENHRQGVSPRRSCISWNVVAVLLATTLIAICEHAAHILLQTTGPLSDFDLQFAAFFVKTACLALIVVCLLSKFHRDKEAIRKERRRCAFHTFMHSHGDKMVAVDKLRAWFGEDAIFDAKVLTKWVADEREYWQYRED